MTEDDLVDMANLLGDSEVMRFYPRVMDRSEALAWIHRSQDLYREAGLGLWRISLRETDEFVGDCGYTPQEVEGRTDIEIATTFARIFRAAAMPRKRRLPVVITPAMPTASAG
jgi:RimJ/RimL family protein N-acetyltransferase